MKKEILERVCFNCNHYFPVTLGEQDEFGICLNDEEFEPFIDELLEHNHYSCCQDLIDRKKFVAEREACADYSEIEDCFEIDGDSEFGRELLSAIEGGQLNTKAVEELITRERLRNIDLKTLPVREYSSQLNHPKSERREAALSTLGALTASGNKAAFQELFNYLQQLPPPKTIEEVHLKRDVLRQINQREFRSFLVPSLVDELYRTPSNNTTRQWISDVLKALEYASPQEIHEPMEKMLKDSRFSYRLKQKIKNILYR